MKTLRWMLPLTATFILGLAACDVDDDDTSDDTATDGSATDGSATDGSATDGEDTEGATGDGTATGDGSDDGSQACEGDNPQGCAEGSCGEGEVCSLETEECASSSCSCDEASGQWNCTPDCNGGVCVPVEEVMECEGDNPQGCLEGGCGEGEVCSFETEECISSGCACDEGSGEWTCTPDCGGGVCVPEGAGACAGPNPADECSEDPEACIPSGCACDPVAEVWNCTPDCSGGKAC